MLLCVSSTPARGQDAESTSASAHFEITWDADPSSPDAPDLTDTDNDGVPDGIARVLDTFERARGFLVDDLGYRAPPNEGRYPLFVAAAQGFGYTQALFLTEERSQPSYILVPIRMVRADMDQGQIDIFAVHEFHHAIQFGYDVNDDHWIREATSTWLEDVWRDDLDRNHLLVRAFVTQPELALDFVGSQHEYGAFLYMQYLSERYDNGGKDLVREIWERLADPGVGSLQAIEAALSARGVSLSSAWGEFLLWRWRLERFSEGEAYIRELGDGVWPIAGAVDPVASDSCRRELAPMSRLASSYFKIKPANDAPRFGLAHLTVAGPPGSAGMAELKIKGLPATDEVLSFDEDGVARLDVLFGKRQTKKLVLGLSTTEMPEPGPLKPRELAWSLRFDGRESTVLSPLRGPERTSIFNTPIISGSVTCAGGPVEGAEIVVTETDASGDEKEYPAVSGADGSWSVLAEPGSRSTYTAEVSDPLLGAATSGPITIEILIEVSLVVADPRVPLGEPIRIDGRTFPALEGARVTLEFRRPERPWRQGPTVTTGPGGDYSLGFELPREGVWEIRVSGVPPDASYLGNTSTRRNVVIGGT